MDEYCVYIIKSLKHDLFYIGHTANITDRLKRHNENRSTYTRNKGPWELVITKSCISKAEAYQLEMKLKGMKDSNKAINYLTKLNS